MLDCRLGRRIRLAGLSLTVAMGFLAGMVQADAAQALDCTPANVLAPPPMAPLPGSCFEGFDGNLADPDGTPAAGDPANRIDWDSVPAAVTGDYVVGKNDSQFGPGGSEEEPESWTFDLGSLGSDEYDFAKGFSYPEETTGDLFLAMAFQRVTNNGESHLAFELNQLQPGYRIADETHSTRKIAVPTRSTGDLLITYSVPNNANPVPRLGLCAWVGDMHKGRWTDFAGVPVGKAECPVLGADMAQGAMNQATVNGMTKGTFGEGVLNLTKALAASGGQPPHTSDCVDYGYLWMHSRSSPSITSNQQDYILPDDALITANCAVSGTKYDDDNGNGLLDGADGPLGGWTIFVDYDDDGVLDNGEPSDVTAPRDANDLRPPGSYTITDVAAGTWKVKEVGQAGWHCTAPAPCSHEVVMVGDAVGGQDFLNFHPAPGIAVDKTLRIGDAGQFAEGPLNAHVGDVVQYQFTVTNTGNVALAVDFSDPMCDPGSLVGPISIPDDGDGKLDPLEVWVYACTHKITANDADPLVNVVTVTGTDPYDNTDSDSDTETVEVLHPGIAVEKSGPGFAYHGDTITFRFRVTNPGDAPLHAVKVVDDRCSPVGAAPVEKLLDNGDALLDHGETWIFECTTTVGSHADAEEDPIHNTATASGLDALGATVSASDDHTTDLLHAAVDIVKTAPETAVAGTAVPYTLTVTNAGDVAIVGQTLAVTDPRCNSMPILQSKANGNGADQTPETLDAGDVWTYTCSADTLATDTAIDNTAFVSGTDVNLRPVEDASPAHTTLTKPEDPKIEVLPETVVSGAAKLRGPASCVRASFNVRVTGRNIKSVRWTIDSRTIKRFSSRSGTAKSVSLRINPARYDGGVHRIAARVTFRAAAQTPAKTLRMTFQSCAKQLIRPNFTG